MSTATLERPTEFLRGVEAQTEVDKKRGIIRAIISDDTCDRFSTVLDPEGCDWEDFMRGGGPILFEHGQDLTRGRLPVGNVLSLGLSKVKGRTSIVAEARLWDDDEFSAKLKARYMSQRMRGWSIRGLPHEMSRPTEAERRARADWGTADLIYRSYSLVELSCTSTPGNVNCLTTDVARSAAGSFASLYGTADGYTIGPSEFSVYKYMTRTINGMDFPEQRIIAKTDDEALARFMCGKG